MKEINEKASYMKPDLSAIAIDSQADCLTSSIENAGEDNYGEF